MVNKIIEFSVKNRNLVLVFTFFFMIAGWMAFKNLSIDALPDITNIQVSVNTQVEGLAPEETERTITIPIETSMNGIASVTHVRSLTKFGLSQVVINFEDGVDIYKARQQVSERLQSVLDDLPPGASPQLGPVTTGLGEIYFYTVEADKIATGEDRIEQLMELRAIQEWVIRPRLMTVKGVAGIDTNGGYEKQYHIQPDIAKMAQLGLGFDEIEMALTKTNKNVGGGYIQHEGKQFLVQAIGLFQTPDDIKRVPIKSLETLQTITIGDVATVTLAAPQRTGAALVDGKQAVVGIALLLSGENSRTVAVEVDKKINEIRKNLPQGTHIKTIHNRSDLVNATIDTVMHNLMIGAALVVVILLLLVGNFRAAAVTAAMIPLSLFFTFLMMNWQGMSGNLMSLGALDFGIIVDATVIVLENCVRKIHERTRSLGRSLNQTERDETITAATIEMREASGFGQLIILAVFLPIFALTGIEGKMFKPMAAAFSFALLGALIFSFTVAPALASLLLRGNIKDNEPWLMRFFKKIYQPVLNKTLSNGRATVLFAMVSVLFGVFLFSRMGSEFLPQLDEGSQVIMIVRDVNIGIDDAITMQEKSEEIIKSFPEIKGTFSRLGTAEIATDPMGIHQADTFIVFQEQKDWPEINGKKRTKEELIEAMLTKLNENIPDQESILSQPIQMRFNELLEGTRADISLKIFGDDLRDLLENSEKIETLLKEVPGAGDVEAEMSDTSPVLKINPNGELLLKLGVGVDVVLDAVSTAVGGKESGFLFEGVRRFPIMLRLSEKDRSDLETLKNIPIEVGPNLTMKLKELADIKFDEGFGTIIRENGKRRTAVLINPRGRDTQSFVKEAKQTLEAQIKLTEGSYFEWGGNFKNMEKAQGRLLILTPVVLCLVFMMIYFVFRDVAQTLLIFSGVPLALVGGALALEINHLTFSISAGIGFIALSGIAILNGVVLISYFNQLKSEGHSGRDLVMRGSMMRLRPVLMTALVDIFGFLPMMLSHGIGSEVQKPLATVVIGGILSSTILTLIVLPAVYLMLEKRKMQRRGT